MGGVHNQNVFGRWRWLDGVRAWCDAHDLVVMVGLLFAGMLIMLAFVGTVALTTVWVRWDSLDQRVERIESVLYRGTEKELKDGTGTTTATQW